MRLGVQFNAITERFTPYDTIFEFSTAKDLKDSKLSAACSLHTASGSTSSSTSSLRRRRLMEITEDEEDEHRAKRQSIVVEEKTPPADILDTSNIATSEITTASATPYLSSLDSEAPTPPPSTKYRSIIADLETTPPPPREHTNLDTLRPASPTKSIDDGRRKSSQSTRPDLYSYSSYGSNGKPKVKLGPRPSLDVGSRPHTSSSISTFRPVSSLPAGLRLSKSPSKQREKSQVKHDQEPPSMTISPPPIMETQLFTPQTRSFTGNERPTTSSGVSVRPLPSPSSIAPSQKFPGMTPEKARLMKALELRKKREQKAVAVDTPTPKPKDVPLPEESPLAVVEEQPIAEDLAKDDQDTLKILTDLHTSKKEVAFDASSSTRTDESDAARSDTFSPTETSELAQSTRASSVSESTDETVHAKESNRDGIPQEKAQIHQQKHDQVHSEGKEVSRNEQSKDENDSQILLPKTYTPSPTSTSQETIQAKTEIHDEEEYAQKLKSFEEANSKNKQESLDEDRAALPSKLETSEVSTSQDPEAPSETISNSRPLSTAISVKEWMIPRSKFSNSNLRETGERDSAAPPLPANNLESGKDTPIVVVQRSSKDSKASRTSRKKKRHGHIDPIRTDLDYSDRSAANSDAHLSSDDELMDELHLAVVQEAKPMSVSKSPINSVFPSPEKTKRFSRTFSNPLRQEKNTPAFISPPQSEKRTVSAGAAFLNKINQQQDKSVAKKVNIGVGSISQRIKALEKLSTSTSPPAATGNAATPSTSFFSVRKASVRDSSNASLVSVADRANSFSRNTPSPTTSREGSPDVSRFRDRSGSVKSKADVFRSSPIQMSKLNRPTTESISVTARIVREPSQPPTARSENARNAGESKPVEFKQSPLIINHEKATPSTPQPSKDSTYDRRTSKESSRSSVRPDNKERRSSITVIKDFISEGRTSLSEKRRSMNIDTSFGKTPSKSPSRPPSSHSNRPMSISGRLSFSGRDSTVTSPTQTIGSNSSANDEKPEKKANRTSRMMKRLSSSMSSTRKNLSHALSPTVREESEPPQEARPPKSAPSQMSTVASPTLTVLGEVNVQFPDSLLWKRRGLALDSQGFLVTTAIGSSKDKQGVRRFHLGEFRQPVIPDMDMQELPYSVLLDFKEGGGLQVACEDRNGQVKVLKGMADVLSIL